MISNSSDTVRTFIIGMAFMALFVAITTSLKTTETNVLYTNNIEAVNTETVQVTDPADGSETTALSIFTTVAHANGVEPSVLSMSNSTTKLLGDSTPKEIHRQAQVRAKTAAGDTPVMTSIDKREILWLARIMYSETKRADEQRLIGWVVRNRVDTGYTGRTYEDVAKHSAQFSGLHPYDKRYEHNISRWYASEGESWKTALSLAKEVYFADESERPLALTTRHFYSPNAVASTPMWARDRQPTQLLKDPQTGTVRFALYDKIR